jgi:hypothetical protein
MKKKKNSKKHLRNFFKITLKFLTRPVLPHITVPTCLPRQAELASVFYKTFFVYLGTSLDLIIFFLLKEIILS